MADLHESDTEPLHSEDAHELRIGRIVWRFTLTFAVLGWGAFIAWCVW